MEHDLKIERPYFEAVKDGRKTFEIRYNDRGFQAGDTVWLREYGAYYTGRTLYADIGYVLGYQMQDGYVAFSLLNVREKP